MHLACGSSRQQRMALKHLLVNDKHCFLYCYVSKVACSNWKHILKVLGGTLGNVNAKHKLSHHIGLETELMGDVAQVQTRQHHF
ncbi:carbohydrate sulfotransferase 14 [Podarcis lilfordi]|uniref:Carbohydrate sulfotransferase n=1 Tax=Podarcis lilfordi TaxID=74358 RepID=A0AA35KD98_9SAUR|nr:carbohydrate sulfotransferase 14 [Podarcis lilfordi]